MSRTFSSPALEAMNASSTDQVFLLLAELYGDGIPTQRIARNFEDVEHLGNTYTATNFRMTLPDENDDGAPTVSIEIDNVVPTLIQTLRQNSKPITVKFWVVLASSPDTIEISPFVMDLTNIQYDAFRITGRLQNLDIALEPYPADKYTPFVVPSIFKS